MTANISVKISELTKWCYIFTIAFTFSGLFFFENGKTLLSNFIVASIIMGGISYSLGHRDVGLRDHRILWIFMAYAAMLFVNRIIHGDQYGVIRSIFYVTLFAIFMPRNEALVKSFLIGTIVGGVGLGSISLWQVIHGISRVDGFTNAILFSQACMTIFIINFFFFLDTQKNVKFKFLLLSAMLMSLLGLYFSQSRGVWLSFIFLAMLYFLVNSFKKPLKYISIVSILVLTTLITIQGNNVIKSRINDSIYDLNQAKSGQYDTSWGLRIVAWKSAWLAFVDHPIFGVGTEGFDETKKQQAAMGLVSPLILHPALTHSHSQYMHSLMIRGGFGTIFLFIFLICPFLLTARRDIISPVFFICVSYAICSISDVPFEHQNVLYLYIISLLMFFFINEMKKRTIS